MKKIIVIAITILSHFKLLAQHSTPDYLNGYALKGADTIACKISFDPRNDAPKAAVKILINDNELTFFPGGPVTGYGVEADGEWYHYGAVEVETKLGAQRRTSILFVKKLAAGAIDFYEYTYKIQTTKRVTVNGEEKPGSSSTSSQSYTDYYIGKTDSSNTTLAKPVLLSSFRLKDIEPYISDNAELMANTEKKFSLKKLVALLNEYNNWSSGKRRVQ